MDIVVKDLNKRFKIVLAKRKNNQENPLTSHSISRILDLVFRIKVSIENTTIRNYFDSIGNHLKGLLNSLETIHENELVGKLRDIEEEVLNYLITELRIPLSHYRRIHQETLNQIEYPTISTILPKFLANFIKESILKTNKNLNISYLDFKIELTKIMIQMSINFNHFTNQVAKQFICGNVIAEDFELNVNLLQVEQFLELFFGSRQNYKFYGKVNKFTQLVNLSPEKHFVKSLSLNLTKPRVAYKGPKKTLPLSPMTITYKGLEKGKSNPNDDESQPDVHLHTFRNDGIVVFGKHDMCDVRLPDDDPETENVAMILYNLADNYYFFDCSKKNPCCLKLFDSTDEDGNLIHPYVGQGYLYSFAKTMNFVVREISFEDAEEAEQGVDETTIHYDYDEGKVHSKVKLVCFSKPYEGQEFILKTEVYKKKSEIKTIHTVGSGGDQKFPPDIFIPKDKGISRVHAQFIFDSQSKSWSIADKNSTNGTFRIVKNEDQYSNKKPSDLCNLFKAGYDLDGKMVLITVCNYSFFMTLIEE